MISKGKQFEEKFKECWKKTFPTSFIYRIPDQVTGYKTTSQNPCDFICFTQGKLFLVECKSHGGASISFTAIPQYERLLVYKDIKGVYPGIVIWFKEKDTVIWVPIKEAEKMVKDENKSIKLSMLKEDKYKIIVIPSTKKRVFMDSDYSSLIKEENL
jgi:penicillin-binding protein-related factor A (putative recombinase)